jgi:acylpyruvate hydrolase
MIYCVGRNYQDHALELGNAVPKAEGDPIVFLKSPAALRGLSGEDPLAFADETLHHEAEVVLRLGKNVGHGQAAGWEHVDAMALGLDLTRREEQTKLKEKGLPWTTAKSFAGSAVVGPFISTMDLRDHNAISFRLHVSGSCRQEGNTSDMIFSVERILTYLASLHELRVGDLIFTGTPKGVGPIRRGDRFSLELTQPHYLWDGVL